jgi:hypothetical protein
VFPVFIAHVLFWVFLLIGASDIGWRGCAIYIALWLGGYLASSWLPGVGAAFVSYVALLDIALVFHVFHGDIQLR